MRYKGLADNKANGVVYTPHEMAVYLAQEMIAVSKIESGKITILDPAIGEGELVIAMVEVLLNHGIDERRIIVHGFERDEKTIDSAQERIGQAFPRVSVEIEHVDFLDRIETFEDVFDFVIANPPYIRTQILGSEKAQTIANQLQLSGRIDIYYAFLVHTKKLLKPNGVAGYITSNKFLTIKSGKSVRNYMLENYKIHRITDFGDTKLFNASVLPCIMVFSNGKTSVPEDVKFTTIYETQDANNSDIYESIFDFIDSSGTFRYADGRSFVTQQGTLSSVKKDALWTIMSADKKEWLEKVESKTWLHFSDIGKIRVGIKTTADNVFIGEDWSGPKAGIELLKPLITHRNAGKIVGADEPKWKVLYTHTSVDGKKKALDINQYPQSKAYLESHYEQLSNRSYLSKANRNWYEIWVPQNPDAFKKRKIVFRDISEEPQFWLDETGSIVNGDCYWIEIYDDVFEDTIYLALAIANSRFVERFYDAKFNTKLYSGKRRYMSQYVEQFPIPYVNSDEARELIEIVKQVITAPPAELLEEDYMKRINNLVDCIFD